MDARRKARDKGNPYLANRLNTRYGLSDCNLVVGRWIRSSEAHCGPTRRVRLPPGRPKIKTAGVSTGGRFTWNASTFPVSLTKTPCTEHGEWLYLNSAFARTPLLLSLPPLALRVRSAQPELGARHDSTKKAARLFGDRGRLFFSFPVLRGQRGHFYQMPPRCQHKMCVHSAIGFWLFGYQPCRCLQQRLSARGRTE